MAEIQPTNICCFDLDNDSIDYFKSLGLNVYEGSLGSVFKVDWEKFQTSVLKILVDCDKTANIQEYHVFVADTDNERTRNYKNTEHRINDIESKDERCLTCHNPISRVDLRPYGTNKLRHRFDSISSKKRIDVIFIGPYNEVEYTSDGLVHYSPERYGPYNNYSAWNILHGEDKYGKRVTLGEYELSHTLFESRQNQIKYYRTFHIPSRQYDDEFKQDRAYCSLLENENGECISYAFCPSDDYIRFVLPQVKNKASILKDLFEKFLFVSFSQFFPDVEANRWIYQPEYRLPEEKQIDAEIAAKRVEYEKEITILEQKSEEVSQKYSFLKEMLTSTGNQLVKVVKTYLEWLGFENVIDKDETLNEGKLKEEDLCFEYEGTHILMEIKGINHTSTDSECSQVDKIVSRRMRQLDTTKVHGVYVVNHQRNVEPLKRQMPPFNENQVKDAESQSRTLIYTIQLFSLYSDIENGYITKEQARKELLQAGFVDFHRHMVALGVPYSYFQDDTVICLDLHDMRVSVGDTLYYKDALQRLVGLTVVSIKQEKQSFETITDGKTGIKVDKKVPRNRIIFKFPSY